MRSLISKLFGQPKPESGPVLVSQTNKLEPGEQLEDSEHIYITNLGDRPVIVTIERDQITITPVEAQTQPADVPPTTTPT